MDARSSSVSSNHGSSRSMSNRPVCIEVISTAPKIHELETRPGFNWYRCIEPILEDQRVYLPTILLDWGVPLQGEEGEGVRADSGGLSCQPNHGLQQISTTGAMVASFLIPRLCTHGLGMRVVQRLPVPTVSK